MKQRQLPSKLIAIILVVPTIAQAAESPSNQEIQILTKQVVEGGNPNAALRLAEIGVPAVDALRQAMNKPNKRFAAICAWAISEHPTEISCGNR